MNTMFPELFVVAVATSCVHPSSLYNVNLQPDILVPVLSVLVKDAFPSCTSTLKLKKFGSTKFENIKFCTEPELNWKYK